MINKTTKFCLIVLLLFFSTINSFSQYKLESLTGQGRPALRDPDAFARHLKSIAEQIVIAQLGDSVYYSWADTAYKYPHYYNNVYFNSAPSEQNYRVAFWFNRGKPYHLAFELVFDPSGLQLVYPPDQYLPDCRNHPSECRFIDTARARSIAREELKKKIKAEGSLYFVYDTGFHTFTWLYYVSEMTDYPRGRTGTILMDANDGRLLQSQFEKDVWMGRCLSANTLISVPGGSCKVQDLKAGDTVMSVNEEGKSVLLPVLEVSKSPVSKGHMMLDLKLEDGRQIRISPNHPTSESGRLFSDLHAGEMLDNSVIISISPILYTENFTYDLLTAGLYGGYIANGILVGSTLNGENR
jgi:hypothetical protein